VIIFQTDSDIFHITTSICCDVLSGDSNVFFSIQSEHTSKTWHASQDQKTRWTQPPPKAVYCSTQTQCLTPWSRILHEKLMVIWLVKKLLAFYGTPKFHYHVGKSPLPLVSVLSLINSVHTFQANYS
jgi:hypothetical protein